VGVLIQALVIASMGPLLVSSGDLQFEPSMAGWAPLLQWGRCW